MLSRDSALGDWPQNESFESLYDRGLPIPKGEWVEHLMTEFFNYRLNQIPAPVDLLAHMETAGIIVDEFEAFIDARIALAAVLNSRHITSN